MSRATGEARRLIAASWRQLLQRMRGPHPVSSEPVQEFWIGLSPGAEIVFRCDHGHSCLISLVGIDAASGAAELVYSDRERSWPRTALRVGRFMDLDFGGDEASDKLHLTNLGSQLISSHMAPPGRIELRAVVSRRVRCFVVTQGTEVELLGLRAT